METIDRILDFEGFARSIPSYCHVRLAYAPGENNSKFVVVCSQPPNYHGTSVTNAFEIIAKTLLENKLLADKDFDTQDSQWSKWLLEVAVEGIALPGHEEKSIVDAFIEFLRAREPAAQLIPWTKCFDSPRFLWIERYPPGVGLRGNVDDLARVELSDQSGTPSWNYFGPEQLSQITGYAIENLLVSVDQIGDAANKVRA